MPSKLRRYDEYGHVHFLTISCYRRLQFFRHDPVKRVFVDGMSRTRAKLGVRWVGYVVMAEHVHLLVLPMAVGANEPVEISTVLQDVKQYLGRHGKEALHSIWGEGGNPVTGPPNPSSGQVPDADRSGRSADLPPTPAPVALTPPDRGRQLTPSDPSELSFLSVNTRTPYVVDYHGEGSG